MDAQTSGGESLAQRWRAHCQNHPQDFLALGGPAAGRKQIERWESRMVEQLERQDTPLLDRAIALRSIVELRGCTFRAAATFFVVDPRVIVAGLSLLEVPRDQSPDGSQGSAHRPRGKSRRDAA